MKRYAIFLILFVFMHQAFACTVWGAITPHNVLLGKNRDFYPGNQKFLTVAKKDKYKFFALYGDNQYDRQYVIKMGVNEKGLAVFMTFASTIPAAKREAKTPYFKVMENILENYSSTNDIFKNSQKLFYDSTPINYIFADRKSIMLCEIGLNNVYACKTTQRSNQHKITFMAQTNHYILPSMQRYNLTDPNDQQTSYLRFARINHLMLSHLSQLSFHYFIEFSFDTKAPNDYPPAKFDNDFKNTYQDNSIFRTFNSHPDRRNPQQANSDQAVSSMIVEIPRDQKKPIRLYLRIINKMTDLNDKNFTQTIDYIDAQTTLKQALAYPESISFKQKTLKRNILSNS